MSDTMETVSQKTLMEKPKEILDRVSEKHIPTLVTKDDEPTVVIMPYETYQQFLKERKKRLTQVVENMQSWVSENAEILKGLDSVKLVRETRERR
ncbi:MAG: type II toxin-antitoxin system Phd/YefM family antitoxin [Candidatus Poribacteria bacterium]